MSLMFSIFFSILFLDADRVIPDKADFRTAFRVLNLSMRTQQQTEVVVMPAFIDITGQKFSHLKVLRRDPTNKRGYWYCECDCKRIVIVYGGHLRCGSTKSCGICLKHNMSYTKEYGTWKHLIQRCTNSKAARYRDYGGRGIKVCAGIRNSFEVFYSLVGDRPGNHSIDRIDNEKNYSCGSCNDCNKNEWILNIRWATIEIQSNNNRSNVRITYKGKTQTRKQWSNELGFKADVLRNRLRRGWTIEEAFNRPLNIRRG